MKKLLSCVCWALIWAQSGLIAQNTPANTPKNIILLIGDGMGIAQISAGMYINGLHLELERFPVTGLSKTYSASHLVTDSGAGATAFACGVKTYNTAIGVGRDRKPCLSILEQAEQKGLATGLVATSSITHATPASFIAHVSDRADMEAIATCFLNTDLDFFVGGGMDYFNRRKNDQRDLVKELMDKGYRISNFQENKLSELQPDPAAPFGWFSALREPDSVQAGRDYLPLAARLSTDFLNKRSEKGFFLMIEGSQIDWACHARDSSRTVAEMLDFDAAIGEVLRFAEKDGQTLVVLTADHETGGLALLQGDDYDSLHLAYNTGGHTASLVPVFAYGPGAERFGGVIENTDIYRKMAELWGLRL